MKTILVIDDNLTDLELIARPLRAVGLKVITCSVSKEALQQIRQVQPDLVITDIIMPELSGFELTRLIKRDPDLQQIPVVACTSKSSDMDRLWALKQGIAQYITKPFTSEQVVSAAQALLH